MAGLPDILNEMRNRSENEHQKGISFEQFMLLYFKTDKLYADIIEDIWQYKDWPDLPENWLRENSGIDLVAKTYAGEYWAIQCKFYKSPSIRKDHVASFISDSQKEFTVNGEKKTFVYRLFVATLDKLGPQADKAIKDIPNFGVLYLKDMEQASIDWSQFTLGKRESLVKKRVNDIREYQQDAVNAVINGFKESDRGKLIMACGTGKTFTSLQIMQEMVPDDGLCLFLAPSLALVSQTLHEWCEQAKQPIHPVIVCSDDHIGRGKVVRAEEEDAEDMNANEIGYPVTTKPQKIASEIAKARSGHRRVIFATYQSIQSIIEAQESAGLPAFDLVICDEAHRTTGLTEKEKDSSNFVKVHRKDLLNAKKRLYMTATPRIYSEDKKDKANENGSTVYSMDDAAVYGPRFHLFTFGDAVDKGVLVEYKVVIVVVRENITDIRKKTNLRFDKKIDIPDDFATKIFGVWKGLSKQDIKEIDGEKITNSLDSDPMKRAVFFTKDINTSKNIIKSFSSIVNYFVTDNSISTSKTICNAFSPTVNIAKTDHDDRNHLLDISLRHVDSDMNMGKRNECLMWLKENPTDGECRVLTNVRCLSEGVDVPSLDAVVFFDARKSTVDIVQAVGRVMRKDGNKKFGYVILPIIVPEKYLISNDTLDNYIKERSNFTEVWEVLKALLDHDGRLIDEAVYREHLKIIDGRDKNTGGNDVSIDFSQIVKSFVNGTYPCITSCLVENDLKYAAVAERVAERIIIRIRVSLKKEECRSAFDLFLKSIRKNINAVISEYEVIEMLAQHVITKPIFDAISQDYLFTKKNPVFQDVQRILDVLDEQGVDKENGFAAEIANLSSFYDSVIQRASVAKSAESRQELIRNIYDTFFKAAFPKVGQSLMGVYTPVEVVDFILNSANDALEKHFVGNWKLGGKSIQILDPFTGTGTFIARLLQSGLLDDESVKRKYNTEIHANEITLLAYYISALNIEIAYHARTGEYLSFDNIVMTDTFQMYENINGNEQQEPDNYDYLQDNFKRADNQRSARIGVIVGSPPYAASLENVKYESLDQDIRNTYGKELSDKKSLFLHEGYTRALRLAYNSLALNETGKRGVIGFFTNSSFIYEKNYAELRRCLVNDFTHVYIFNLRGFTSGKNGEAEKREGQNISGIDTGEVILILVRDPARTGSCDLFYHDIGDNLTREEKLAKIKDFGSIDKVAWQKVPHDEDGSWGSPEFMSFIKLGVQGAGSHVDCIFYKYGTGIVTGNDHWTFNKSKEMLESNTRKMIDVFNEESSNYELACNGLPQNQWPELNDSAMIGPNKIKWPKKTKDNLKVNKHCDFDSDSLRISTRYPFTKEWLYYNTDFNKMQSILQKVFPTSKHRNLVITVNTSKFSCLILDTIPNGVGQAFPLYLYESKESSKKKSPDAVQDGFFTGEESEEPKSQADEYGYTRHDAITDWALKTFRERYSDTKINKEDIFWYVYGLLHSSEYIARFSSDLNNNLPRIPLAKDFWAFSNAGRKLGELHLNYETVEPWPLKEIWTDGKRGNYHVEDISFAAKETKGDSERMVQPSAIIYNSSLTLEGIPDEAYEYKVNNKSAIKWIMEKYSVNVDKNSGIVNDPNLWCAEHNDPTYIVNLIKRIVRVSVESVQIINYLRKKEIE